MIYPIPQLVSLAFVLVVPALFWLAGPRRAVLIAVVGGYVFLPYTWGVNFVPGTGWIEINKLTTAGLGVLLGILIVDRSALRRFKPHWADLPMLAFIVLPLASWAANHFERPDYAVGQTLSRGVSWGVFYLAGRLYFGHGEGVRSISAALVTAGMACVPLCLYELAAGPSWYLAARIYGKSLDPGHIERLGGMRPELFFRQGLELGSWMALATVTAAYLWLCRGGWNPPWRVPRWVPTLVLAATTIACRSVYGYILLAVGLAAAGLMLTFRARWPIVFLLLAQPTYVALRVSNTWDGGQLVEAARWAGRPDTVAYRIRGENEYTEVVKAHNLALGLGGSPWGIYDWWSKHFLFIDSGWLYFLLEGGVIGVAAFSSALFLVPAGLAAVGLPSRTIRGSPVSPAWALALFVALHMVDTIHNYNWIGPTGLIGGSLVGLVLLGRAAAKEAGSGSRHAGETSEPHRERPARAVATENTPAALIAAFACLMYVFGHADVEGYKEVKLIGGLGACLLFAASGWVGAWASSRFSWKILAIYAILFALFGVSFNLALYPTRSVWSCDILQGLALCGLAVALWRRLTGGRAWADALLAVPPLVAHFLLRPVVPEFPGSQFLVTGSSVDLSFFPLCPWLTFAALGAWARRETLRVNLAAAALFGAATAFVWGSSPVAGGPVKIPMNLSYTLLGCFAACAAIVLARVVEARQPLARALEWLGRNWLVFFYLQFAVGAALLRAQVRSPAAVWALQAVGTVGATWLVSATGSRLSPWFRKPAPWGVLLAAIAAVAVWPGLPPGVVTGVAGVAGLVFAAEHGALAALVVGARSSATADRSSSFTKVPHSEARTDLLAAGHTSWVDLARFAGVLALLAAPELLGMVTENRSSRALPSQRPVSSEAAVVAPDGATPRLPGPQEDGDDLMRRLKAWEQKQKEAPR